MDNNCILIVDDEIRIQRMLSDYFTSQNFTVLLASNGVEAMDIFYENSNKINIILLDVMMPLKDGYETIKEIRESSTVPVIFLTAKSENYDQVNGFKYGADDYISKPFSPTVLLARINAVLKRINNSTDGIIEIGKIKIDNLKKQVFFDSNAIELTPKEYDLLMYFITNKNIALSRENILNIVWGFNYLGDIRTVDTHIKQLRAKLGLTCKYIKTVHGLGYRFEV